MHLAGHELRRIREVADSTATHFEIGVAPRLPAVDALAWSMILEQGYARGVADFARYLLTGQASDDLGRLLDIREDHL